MAAWHKPTRVSRACMRVYLWCLRLCAAGSCCSSCRYCCCCRHRALSLPAALSINVSQAAFRSMLDLTTPFCIVMTVNAANYLLNQLLMVTFPYGMAGCGWASVISQV